MYALFVCLKNQTNVRLIDRILTFYWTLVSIYDDFMVFYYLFVKCKYKQLDLRIYTKIYVVNTKKNCKISPCMTKRSDIVRKSLSEYKLLSVKYDPLS